MEKTILTFLSFFISVTLVSATQEDTLSLEPREPFSIPLARLSVSYGQHSDQIEHVRITFENSRDQIIISSLDDTHLEYTRHGMQKTIYRESLEKSYYLSDFEAEQLNRVCKTFIATLEQLEKDIQNEKWGKCLYLDAYLPRFLRGFYYLMGSARGSVDALSKNIRIPITEYDVSLNSPKSDARIGYWRSTPDYLIKLRITIKELIHQTRLWQKRELLNSKRNREISYSSNFEEAFALFVKVYFNQLTPSQIRKKP